MPNESGPPDAPFVVQDIFPPNDIHLIIGPGGAGKSTLALQMLDDWEQAVYVACTRSRNALREHMQRLEIDPAKVPHLSLVTLKREECSIESVLRYARETAPDLRVLVLDGMAMLCPGNINHYKDVSQFLIAAVCVAERERVTIIGCVSSSKSKEGAGYASPRERITGSVAWTETTSTKMLIEPCKSADPTDPTRVLFVMPQHRAPQTLYYTFEGYRLVPRSESPFDATLDGWLAQQAPQSRFDTQQLRSVADALGVSKPTFYRWLAAQLQLGSLVRIRVGEYEVPLAPRVA